MLKRSFLMLASVCCAFAINACNKEIEYNSNTGFDGSRDSATQLLVNTSKVSDISAPDGDNEDWYYFQPPEKGLIKVIANIDNPKDLIVTITVHDSMGRSLHHVTTDETKGVYEFAPIEVTSERYFISFKTTHGKSPYAIRADFEIPAPIVIIPEPECSDTKPCADENQICESNVCVDKPEKSRCVPLNRCKRGERCCKAKPAQPAAPAEEGVIPEGTKSIVGTITLVTPNGEISDIKISGAGKSKGVKKGAKAYLRGLKRKVDIYSVLSTSCMGTVRASSEELSHYDKVDIVVE